jgi:hypothetical protein
MLKEVVCNDRVAIARRVTLALAASGFLLVAASSAQAQAQAPALPPVTVGAGVQTAFVSDNPDGGSVTNRFELVSVRLYVNGPVTKKFNFTFNTEYDGIGGTSPNVNNRLIVLDAIARFEYSPKFNIWAGRFLEPSDRANLYGPYYAHHWNVYTSGEGVQDGYPFMEVGRDNGVAYWGQFDKVKVSGGVFDGPSTTGASKPLEAGRVQVDFWDPEPGYYLNSTYYGSKNLLAVGVAGQVQGSDKKAWTVDFLLEKKLPGNSAFTIESEYGDYDKLGGYNGRYNTDKGAYLLGSYLFPSATGAPGKFEILGKFAKANYTNGLNPIDVDYSQKTSEINLNYIIKDFNARVMIFYLDKHFNAVGVNDKQNGVGLQLQM